MEYKFLFGSYRMVEVGKEDSPENMNLKDMMLISRRCHTLQHLDVKKFTRLHPSTGGFVGGVRKTTTMHWFGESESCQVSTDASMDKLYRALVSQENIFKIEIEMYHQPHVVLAFCPAGFRPSSILTGIEWEQISYQDAYEELKAEASVYSR